MKRKNFARSLMLSAATVSTVLAAATTAHAVTVSACTDSAMCGSGTGSCTISNTVQVEPGSVLDCSGRDLTVTGGGSLKVTDGGFVLLADDLTVDGPGGTILGIEGSENIAGDIEIQLTGALSLSGKIRANGDHGGGRINVHADGNITIPESGTDGVEADGTGPGASGGDITLTAGGTIVVNDPIHAAGAGSGGTDGGRVTLRGNSGVTLSVEGHLSAEGIDGIGGEIVVESEAGNILVQEHIDVEGRGQRGDGGSIELKAAGSVQIQEQITARGGANANGGQARGGSILVSSGCAGTTIAANLLATGGQLPGSADGGGISLVSGGLVTIANGILVDAHALASNGKGGNVRVSSTAGFSIGTSATIDVSGGATNPGRGGSLQVVACTVQLTSTSVLKATGYDGGVIEFEATNLAPVETDQPMRIPTGAMVHSAGGAGGALGSILLSTALKTDGRCTNDAPCFTDADCTAGCYTSECAYANPDTDGILTQFDVVPERRPSFATGTCTTSCTP